MVAQPGQPQQLQVTLARTPPPPPRVVVRTEPEPNTTLPWTLTLAGGGLLAAAAVTGVLALGADREVTSECAPRGAPCERLELRSAQSRAKTLAAVTDVLWVSGAASAAVGVGWLLLRGGGEGEQPARAARIGGAAWRW